MLVILINGKLIFQGTKQTDQSKRRATFCAKNVSEADWLRQFTKRKSTTKHVKKYLATVLTPIYSDFIVRVFLGRVFRYMPLDQTDLHKYNTLR